MTAAPDPSGHRLSRQVRLVSRPVGEPQPSDFDLTSESLRPPEQGEIAVRVVYVSLDPAMRGWMDDRPSYLPPVGLGEVMRAGGLGEVVVSRHPRFAVGDVVSGSFGVQTAALSDGRGVASVDPGLAPLPTWMGVLGMTGMTAYFGLTEVGRAQEGDTVVVSGAAGATGATVAQVAKVLGCRVVGIAGGPDKTRWLAEELGLDAVIDYKSEDVGRALRAACPDGIDVYFDNVGGAILDAALARLSRGARVVICGAISQYNATERTPGPSNYLNLLVQRASMTGFLVFDYADRFGDAVQRLAGWMAEGRLRSREDIVTGIESFQPALLRLFSGANTGKLLLQVGPEPGQAAA